MCKKAFLPAVILILWGHAFGQSDDYDRLIRLNQSLSSLGISPAEAIDFDVSAAVLSRNRSEIVEVRNQILAMEVDDWPVGRKVDYLLVLARANELLAQHRLVRPWFRDAGFYLDRIRSVPHVELPLQSQDLEKLQEKLQSVSGWLLQARQNLATEASGSLADLALFHLQNYDGVGQGEPLRADPPPGVVGWYRDLVQRLPHHHPELREDAREALQAVEGFRDWLAAHRATMTVPCQIGLEEYSWYLEQVRLMPFTAEDVRRLGERELERAVTFLKIEQNKNRALPELRIAESRQEYEARVEAAEKHIRLLIADQRLMTIPEGIGPLATDAFWRAGLKRHFWEELQFRDAHNNHVHASIPGHRFDMLVAAKNTHPIRSLVRDGGRIEGWAFYIEEMLLQAGLLDENPRARELFYIAQIARAVRIPTELNMQSGELSFEAAIPYMVERVPFMEESLARYDLEIYLRNPTYGMNYVMGRVQLEQLLTDRAQQLGDRFDLGSFHDQFLSFGLIPISMIRWEMTGKDDQAQRLWERLRR